MTALPMPAPDVRTPGGNPANAETGGRNENPDCCCASMADQAAAVIEGEGYARAWLQRQRAGTAQPGELAVILAFLGGGHMLQGACRVIEKAMGPQP